MSTVKYTATALNGTNKQGVLTPDANGYYTMPVGGLNAYNDANEYYLLEGAKRLFDSSSTFQARVRDGVLFGELGHPKFMPGMRMNEFIERVMVVHEDNIVAHFSEIWLDENFGRDNPQHGNPNLVAIMAKVKPAGIKAPALEQAFANPKQNVCFSIRALTNDHRANGRRERVLTSIVTFDYVVASGIDHAKKWHSPALESLSDFNVSSSKIIEVSKEILDSPFALESTKKVALENIKLFERSRSATPVYANW